MSLLLNVPYTYRKDGIYYLQRYVPEDVRQHYKTNRISFSLRTKSAREACALSRSASAKLEAYWHSLRLAYGEVPAQHLVSLRSQDHGDGTDIEQPVDLSLTEAGEVYLRLKGSNKPKTFHSAVERALSYVVKVIGNKPLQAISRKDAAAVRDDLVAKGLAPSSVTRVLTTIKAVINFAIQEEGIELSNPFKGLFVDKSIGPKKRMPVPLNDLQRVQKQCWNVDDDLRWIVAAISDTGCRMAEIVGLSKADVRLDGDIPFISISPKPWRRLKTASSERDIPLVGSALWGITRAYQSTNSEMLFPRYNNGLYSNSNSASAALSKWLKQQTKPDCTMHSFRHSFRDRLRAVECPIELTDALGGWSTDGIGAAYGQGYSLELKQKWLSAIVLNP
jgi:integrase